MENIESIFARELPGIVDAVVAAVKPHIAGVEQRMHNSIGTLETKLGGAIAALPQPDSLDEIRVAILDLSRSINGERQTAHNTALIVAELSNIKSKVDTLLKQCNVEPVEPAPRVAAVLSASSKTAKASFAQHVTAMLQNRDRMITLMKDNGVWDDFMAKYGDDLLRQYKQLNTEPFDTVEDLFTYDGPSITGLSTALRKNLSSFFNVTNQKKPERAAVVESIKAIVNGMNSATGTTVTKNEAAALCDALDADNDDADNDDTPDADNDNTPVTLTSKLVKPVKPVIDKVAARPVKPVKPVRPVRPVKPVRRVASKP